MLKRERLRESLKKQVESTIERLLNAVEGEGILAGGKMEREVLVARNKNFMVKSLHSQFMRKTDEVGSQEN